MLQWMLNNSGFELIFIDEFHFSFRKTKFRWRVLNDRMNKIVTPVEGFSMYFILAISHNHFYRIVASKNANTAKLFINFLNNLLCTINKQTFKIMIKKYALFLTTDEFLKTNDVKYYGVNNKLHILTIPLYLPSLNAAKMVINSIKWKVKKIRATGK